MWHKSRQKHVIPFPNSVSHPCTKRVSASPPWLSSFNEAKSQKPKRKKKLGMFSQTDVWSAQTSSFYKSLTSPHKPRMQILSSSSTLYVTVTFRTNLPSKFFSFSFSFLYIPSGPSRLVLLKAQRVEESYHSFSKQRLRKTEDFSFCRRPNIPRRMKGMLSCQLAVHMWIDGFEVYFVW